MTITDKTPHFRGFDSTIGRTVQTYTDGTREIIVNDEDIAALKQEAIEAGDHLQVAICDRALGRDLDCEDPAPLTIGEALAFGEHWPTREAAHDACVETIRAGQG